MMSCQSALDLPLVIDLETMVSRSPCGSLKARQPGFDSLQSVQSLTCCGMHSVDQHVTYRSKDRSGRLIQVFTNLVCTNKDANIFKAAPGDFSWCDIFSECLSPSPWP